MALTGCFAHEASLASKALACPATETVASAPARSLETPREVSGSQTATSILANGLSALVSAASGDDARAFVAAQGTQVAAPGWRHYAGCNKALVCFDGGNCLRVDDAASRATAVKLPELMSQSVAKEHGTCESFWADRRGPLVWTLSGCGRYLACAATNSGTFGCADIK